MYGKFFHRVRNWIINLRSSNNRIAPVGASAKAAPGVVATDATGNKHEPASATISKSVFTDRPSVLGESTLTKKDQPFAVGALPKSTGNSHAAA